MLQVSLRQKHIRNKQIKQIFGCINTNQTMKKSIKIASSFSNLHVTLNRVSTTAIIEIINNNLQLVFIAFTNFLNCNVDDINN